MGKRVDMTNKTFGWVKVIEYSHSDADKNACWKCMCEVCGKEFVIAGKRLRGGDNVSCGCMMGCINITGQQFGKLKAVKPLNEMDGDSRIWLFECECGNLHKTSCDSVKSHRKISCGCARTPARLANIAKAIEAVERIENTSVNSLKNDKLYSNSTSGARGVNWNKKVQRWVVRITFKKKTYCVGYYKDFDEAVKARKNAEQLTHEAFLEWYERYKDNLDDAPESPDGSELKKLK